MDAICGVHAGCKIGGQDRGDGKPACKPGAR